MTTHSKFLVEFGDIDRYGQRHPIESPQLIRTTLEELEVELEKRCRCESDNGKSKVSKKAMKKQIKQQEKKKLPSAASSSPSASPSSSSSSSSSKVSYNVSAYQQALQKCPELVSDKEKLMFLRAEVFNVILAADRLLRYWDKRLVLFGPEKAFLPLTQDGALRDDKVAMGRGFARLIPIAPSSPSPSNRYDDDNTEAGAAGAANYDDDKNNIQRRYIILIEPGRQDLKLYSRESMVRSVWYVVHACLEDDEMTQRHGLIAIGFAATAKPSGFDHKLESMLAQSIRGNLPVRVTAVHICQPHALFRIIFPILQLLLGERIRQRIHVHGGTDEHVKERLLKYGIVEDMLPTELGGPIVVDHKSYLQRRREVGK